MRQGNQFLPPFLPLSEARARLGHYLGQAQHYDGWIEILKHGRCLGALIGPRDLKALEVASRVSIEWNEYQVFERRARIETLHESLNALARQRVRDAHTS